MKFHLYYAYVLLQYMGKLGGGRDDRPGKSSDGSDDEYSKTVISRVGFDPCL